MSEVEKFYEWMVKVGSIHLADNQQMSKAFEKFNVKKVKEKVGS